MKMSLKEGGLSWTPAHGPDEEQLDAKNSSGQPSMSFSTQASKNQQQIMTQADKDYWSGDPEDPYDNGASFNPPYRLRNKGTGDLDIDYAGIRENESFIKNYVLDFLKEDEINEFCAVGIGGAPSGQIRGAMAPYTKKKKKKKFKK